jgi:hypothetical protein
MNCEFAAQRNQPQILVAQPIPVIRDRSQWVDSARTTGNRE